MEITVNADAHLARDPQLLAVARERVLARLQRYARRLGRVEVFLRDENGDKRGEDDKRCVVEARVLGRRPTVVTHRAETADAAMQGALLKMAAALASTFGRAARARRA
jgi:hypothetical protein